VTGAQDHAPIPTPEHPQGALPNDVFSTAKPVGRYPGRKHPRTGDLVVTIILTVILLVLAVLYVHYAVARAHTDARLVDGTQLANVLAVLAPIVLTVFSLIFSALFILRRVYALWLPVVAGILIVALYSVTQDMLDHAIVSNFFH
jgi:hypothetical protein